MSPKNHLPFAASCLGMISVQTGAAFAKSLFSDIGSDGVAALRIGISALILCVIMPPWRLWRSNPDWKSLISYGVILAMMNLLIYRAFEYIPVSIAISLEVLGPLGAAVATSRQKSDLLWVGIALTGIILLPAGDATGGLNYLGVLYSLAAAFFWGLYVILGQRVSSGGGMSVATGMIVASAITLPLGISEAGLALIDPAVLRTGVIIALLSSMLPFMLDIYAMKRLPPRIFGVLLSGSPAVSAIAGWFVLKESLGVIQVAGIISIMIACSGSAIFSRRNKAL